MVDRMTPDDMKALARALADVAAFIEEVELREGWTLRSNNGQRVARMRDLGRRLELLAPSMVSPLARFLPSSHITKR